MSTVLQRSDAWLKTATPEQITAAFGQGELAELLGQPIPTADDEDQAAEDLRRARQERRAEAGIPRGDDTPTREQRKAARLADVRAHNDDDQDENEDEE